MLKVIQHIYFIPLLISAILSLKAFRLRWPLPYRLFSILLFVIVFVEIAATSWAYWLYDFNGWTYSKNNRWIYNLSIIPQYLLYMAVYYFIIRNVVIKKTILITSVLFSIFTIVNIIYWQTLYDVNSYTHLIADCIILLLSFVYFEQLKKEKEVVKLSLQPMVWISFGACVYHLLNIPYLFGMNYLVKNNFISFAYSFHYFYLIFQCIMYISYAKAFLCPTPQQK
jgi:hypothetical protein